MSAMATMPVLARELAGIVGEPHVFEDRTRLEELAIDGVAAKALVRPGSPQEVAASVPGLPVDWPSALIVPDRTQARPAMEKAGRLPSRM